MKQLLILSGKGGTGKTTIASGFIELGGVKGFADCDVDAPNLELILRQKVKARTRNYYGMEKARIDIEKCIGCGECFKVCRFKGIERNENTYSVNNLNCEGCGVCSRICSENAIDMLENKAGELKYFKDDRVFSTAELKMGEGNSGLLVTEVKEQLKNEDLELIIIDGSPGIGCPVIASINNVDLVLVVAEPSVSGISDLKRIVELARNFDIEVLVTINKYDLSLENTEKILDYCLEEKIEMVGKIPFDKNIIEELNKGRTIIGSESKGSKSMKKVFERTMEVLKIMEG